MAADEGVEPVTCPQCGCTFNPADSGAPQDSGGDVGGGSLPPELLAAMQGGGGATP